MPRKTAKKIVNAVDTATAIPSAAVKVARTTGNTAARAATAVANVAEDVVEVKRNFLMQPHTVMRWHLMAATAALLVAIIL
jgi:2,4-dienoyl-CoA reductase-like NADH-dependent reductase (Old Yellow Enzyme family)